MTQDIKTAPLLAGLCVLAGMATLGLSDNFLVNLADESSLWQFHTFRAAIILPVLMILSFFGFGRIRATKVAGVMLRSVCFGLSMLIYFGCLAFLPISEVVGGLFCSPILVMAISALVLGKKVGVFRWVAAIVGFVGILLVLRPDSGDFTWVTVLPLVAALFYAVSALATREMCEGESTVTLVFWFFFTVGLFGLIGMIILTVFPQAAPEGADGFILRGYTDPSASFWFWTAVQAFLSIIGIGLLTRGYQIGEASYVAVFEYSLMIFASFWAWVLRGDVLDAYGAVGIILIVLSGAVIALRSR